MTSQVRSCYSNPKTDCSIGFPTPKNPQFASLHAKIGSETPEIELERGKKQLRLGYVNAKVRIAFLASSF